MKEKTMNQHELETQARAFDFFKKLPKPRMKQSKLDNFIFNSALTMFSIGTGLYIASPYLEHTETLKNAISGFTNLGGSGLLIWLQIKALKFVAFVNKGE